MINARGGDKLEAATAYLARKFGFGHTDDFLASCAVVVSSLLPPFAKTIKGKSTAVGTAMITNVNCHDYKIELCCI
ncbi:hypothetical protein ACP4OV_006360 [Aristida adscensionis]